MPPRLRLPDWLYGLIGILGFVTALEAATRAELVPSRHFPPPTETFGRLLDEVQRASLWSDVASTLEGWAIGLALAVAVAIPLGIALESNAL